MGLCVSVNRNECDSSPTAKIVTINGDLREYKVPVLASQVLESESTASSSTFKSYFLCNSDSLLYDDFIPETEPEEILQADQIYFVLPISKRQYRLTASDMAGLAVKASVAIEKAAGKKNRRRRSGRISPVTMLNQSGDETVMLVMEKGKVGEKTTTFKGLNNNGGGGYYSRSGSVRRLKRYGYGSGKARFAVRDFRLRLSTIYEGEGDVV